MEKEIIIEVNKYFEEVALEQVQQDIDFEKMAETYQNQKLYDNGWL